MSNQEHAFPAHPSALGDHNGMTLRDYFAAQAMQGMLSHPECDYTPMTASAQTQAAADAYGMADAMVAARERA